MFIDYIIVCLDDNNKINNCCTYIYTAIMIIFFLFLTPVSPPFNVISLNSNYNVYTKFTSSSPYFYQTSSTEVEAVLEILNVGVDMVHIYKVNSTIYTLLFI